MTVDQQRTVWAVWKILGGPRPAGLPRAIPPEWWEFLVWAKWRMRGAPLPRPKDIRKSIPARWWVWKRDLEAALATHHDPPPPPVSALSMLARNVEFSAQEPELARQLKPHQRIAWSADRNGGPAYELTQALVDEMRPKLAGLFSWSDCRPEMDSGGNPGTPASYAIALRDKFDLDGWIGQAETQTELRHAVGINLDGSMMSLAEMRDEFGHGERAQIIIGNPNAWTADQRARVIAMQTAGLLAVIVECYANNSHPFPDAYNSQGVRVDSWCIGVYDASGENPNARGWLDPEDYRPHMSVLEWQRTGSYYLAGMHPGKIETLP